jgi:hypothetical protein
MEDIDCRRELGLGRLVSLTRSYYTLLYIDKHAGETYLAHDLLSGQSIVIKLESIKSNNQTLEHEFNVYRMLCGGVGIPRVHWFGTEYGFNAMAMDMLGHSLEDLFIQCHFRFTVKTVVLLACQLVST